MVVGLFVERKRAREGVVVLFIGEKDRDSGGGITLGVVVGKGQALVDDFPFHGQIIR